MLALGAAALLSGCASVSYYSQAVSGHMDLMGRSEPIDELIADPETDIALRSRLETVLEIRRFAVEELGLPDNDSYTDFADLERDAAVYLLTAAPELSLEARRWCYFIVGCLTYRGYFDAGRAHDHAEQLQQEGYDTRVSPSIAYSTLGFMDDPVLNTMLAYPDDQLAAILFHELAHQVLYVKDDARFSESFSSAVEQIGARRWQLRQGRSPDPGHSDRRRQRERQFNTLMMGAREQLDALFQSAEPDEEKRQGKAAIYAQLRVDYQALRTEWDGFPGFDHWFDEGPNNADLALLSTYESDVPAFLALFEQCEGDLTEFYRRVEALAELDPESRQKALDALVPDH